MGSNKITVSGFETGEYVEIERDVLSLIDSKKGIKRSELDQELDKTDMTIHRAIKKLIEFNMIRRVVSNKTGYWEVIK